MANVKISELNETQDAKDLYIPGSKEENGSTISYKYNLGNLTEKLENAQSFISSPEIDLKIFDNTSFYYPGQYIKYNNIIYRFIKYHTPGEFDIQEVAETTFAEEAEALISSTYEHVYFNLSSSDGLVNVEGKTVTITFADETDPISITTDADGNCDTMILKGKEYSAVVADQTGYRVENFVNTKAAQGIRYLNFIYIKLDQVSQSNVTITVNPVSGDVSLYNNKSAYLTLENGTVMTASIVSGVATFAPIDSYQKCKAGIVDIIGFKTPAEKEFYASDTTIGLTFRPSTTAEDPILYVDTEFNEYTLDTFPEGNTCIAIHINNAALAQKGMDYYVRIADLSTSRTITTKAWQTSNGGWKELPNVPKWNQSTPYYNGSKSTYYMIKDCYSINETSPAAEYVITQTFDYNGHTYYGYIGTRDQLQCLIDARTEIEGALTRFGYTSNYYTTNIWTSSQDGSNYSWSWLSGSWSSYSKGSSGLVLPFFAI